MPVTEIKEPSHLAIDTIKDKEFLEALLRITHSQQSKIDVSFSEKE